MPSIGAEQVIAATFVDAQAARLLTASVSSDPSDLNTARIQAWATDNGGTTWTREGTRLTADGVTYVLTGRDARLRKPRGWNGS